MQLRLEWGNLRLLFVRYDWPCSPGGGSKYIIKGLPLVLVDPRAVLVSLYAPWALIACRDATRFQALENAKSTALHFTLYNYASLTGYKFPTIHIQSPPYEIIMELLPRGFSYSARLANLASFFTFFSYFPRKSTILVSFRFVRGSQFYGNLYRMNIPQHLFYIIVNFPRGFLSFYVSD